MGDLALIGVHRFEFLLRARPQHPSSHLVSLRLDSVFPPFAIVLYIYNHADTLVEASSNGSSRELLDGVERLAVSADQQSHVVLVVSFDVDIHMAPDEVRLRDGVDPHV